MDQIKSQRLILIDLQRKEWNWRITTPSHYVHLRGVLLWLGDIPYIQVVDVPLSLLHPFEEFPPYINLLKYKNFVLLGHASRTHAVLQVLWFGCLMLLFYYPWKASSFLIFENLLKGKKASNCLFINVTLSRKLTASSLYLCKIDVQCNHV